MLELGVVVVGHLGDDGLDRLGLDPGLGGVVDAAGQVAVGADLDGGGEQASKHQPVLLSCRRVGMSLSGSRYPRPSAGAFPRWLSGRRRNKDGLGQSRARTIATTSADGTAPTSQESTPYAGLSRSTHQPLSCGCESRLTATGLAVPSGSGGSRTTASRPAVGAAGVLHQQAVAGPAAWAPSSDPRTTARPSRHRATAGSALQLLAGRLDRQGADVPGVLLLAHPGQERPGPGVLRVVDDVVRGCPARRRRRRP